MHIGFELNKSMECQTKVMDKSWSRRTKIHEKTIIYHVILNIKKTEQLN